VTSDFGRTERGRPNPNSVVTSATQIDGEYWFLRAQRLNPPESRGVVTSDTTIDGEDWFLRAQRLNPEWRDIDDDDPIGGVVTSDTTIDGEDWFVRAQRLERLNLLPAAMAWMAAVPHHVFF